MARLLFASMCVLWLGACSREAATPANGDAAGSFRPEPVIVYAAEDSMSRLPGAFEEFTRLTGIHVTVRQRDAATIVSDVVNNHGSPPADVLLTPSVYGGWKAADEGALRPLGIETPGDVRKTLRRSGRGLVFDIQRGTNRAQFRFRR